MQAVCTQFVSVFTEDRVFLVSSTTETDDDDVRSDVKHISYSIYSNSCRFIHYEVFP